MEACQNPRPRERLLEGSGVSTDGVAEKVDEDLPKSTWVGQKLVETERVKTLERFAMDQVKLDSLEAAGRVRSRIGSVWWSNHTRGSKEADHSLANTEQIRFVSAMRSIGTGKILQRGK